MVDAPQHVRAGRGQRRAGVREGPQHLGGRVGVEPGQAEGGPDPGGQVGQALRDRPGPRPRAEQLGQDSIVHLRPPRQPGSRHLDRGQRPRRLGRHQQPKPTRPPAPGPLGGLPGPGAHPGFPGTAPARRRCWSAWTATTPSSSSAGPGRPSRSWSNRAGWPAPASPGRSGGVVGNGQASQAGPGGRERAGLAPAAVGGEQDRLGQAEVVGPVGPGPGPQQARVQLGGGRPDPAGPVGPLPLGHGRGQVPDRLGRPLGRAVLGDGLEQPPALGTNHRDPHGGSLPVPSDSRGQRLTITSSRPGAMSFGLGTTSRLSRWISGHRLASPSLALAMLDRVSPRLTL